MADSNASDTPPLSEIVRRVDERALTLSVYNANVDRSVLSDVQSYFDVQSVELRRAATDDGRPQNFVVLHDDDEFVDATDLESLYRVIRPDSPLLSVTDPADIEYPGLLRSIDQTVFTNYGYDRMVVASREIEEYAHRHGGALHAGFQRYSNLAPQSRLYEHLAESGVETHVYGWPDEEVDSDNHVLHGYEDPEIAKTWFVVLDGDDEHKRALLAEERRRNEFYGFWTFDSDIVDVILARLQAYPPTG